MVKTIQKKKIYNFSVIIEKDENGYFIGIVPDLRGCHTQAKTLPELYNRLKEAVSLCLEVEEGLFKKEIKQNQFIGVQQLEFVK
jgi:predicted RNase H-like HicB family nuclease